MMRVVSVIAAIAFSSSAFGQSLEMRQLASGLGDVIAAEAFCGLSYDQAAIETFINEKVPEDDLTFVGDLTASIEVSAFDQEAMTQSAKTAHCTQIKRAAKAHGFLN